MSLQTPKEIALPDQHVQLSAALVAVLSNAMDQTRTGEPLSIAGLPFAAVLELAAHYVENGLTSTILAKQLRRVNAPAATDSPLAGQMGRDELLRLIADAGVFCTIPQAESLAARIAALQHWPAKVLVEHAQDSLRLLADERKENARLAGMLQLQRAEYDAALERVNARYAADEGVPVRAPYLLAGIEVVPCPSCGRVDSVDLHPTNYPGERKAVCNAHKNGCGLTTAGGDSDAEALAAWNRRANPRSTPPHYDATAHAEGRHTIAGTLDRRHTIVATGGVLA